MANICPACLANLGMVGRMHRCVPRPAERLIHAAQEAVGIVRGEIEPAAVHVRPAPSEAESSSYRYRDADKRRAYMRDYMKKRRAERGLRQG